MFVSLTFLQIAHTALPTSDGTLLSKFVDVDVDHADSESTMCRSTPCSIMRLRSALLLLAILPSHTAWSAAAAISNTVRYSTNVVLAALCKMLDAEVLLRKPMVRSVICAAQAGNSLMLRREACWCFVNATVDAISAQKKQLAADGAIEALCAILNTHNGLTEDHLLVCIENFLLTY